MVANFIFGVVFSIHLLTAVNFSLLMGLIFKNYWLAYLEKKSYLCTKEE